MIIVDTMITIVSWILIIAGSGFLVAGSFGVIRFPDFWSRLHAAAVIDSAGVGLLLLGMVMQAGFTLIAVKLLLIGVFLFITGPTSTHAVANAAYVSGSRPLGDDSGVAISSKDVVDAVVLEAETSGELSSKP